MNARASPWRCATQVVVPLLVACARAGDSAVDGGALTAAGAWQTTSAQRTLR